MHLYQTELRPLKSLWQLMRNTHAQYRRQHRIRGSTQRSSRRHAKTAHQRGSRICVLRCCQPSGQGYLRGVLVARHHVASVTPSTRASGEMADALASGASVRKDVGVQVPPRAPTKCTVRSVAINGNTVCVEYLAQYQFSKGWPEFRTTGILEVNNDLITAWRGYFDFITNKQSIEAVLLLAKHDRYLKRCSYI